MANRRGRSEDEKPRKRRPATTPKSRENQLIALAVDEAERQLRSGTASSQVITHYLKLGSSREKLEQERLANENELLVAKKETLAMQGRIEELYEAAIAAMRSYAGEEPPAPESEDDFDYDDG